MCIEDKQKHRCLCFHYWDFLTNFWRNNWQSMFDFVERLCFSVISDRRPKRFRFKNGSSIQCLLAITSLTIDVGLTLESGCITYCLDGQVCMKIWICWKVVDSLFINFVVFLSINGGNHQFQVFMYQILCCRPIRYVLTLKYKI